MVHKNDKNCLITFLLNLCAVKKINGLKMDVVLRKRNAFGIISN